LTRAKAAVFFLLLAFAILFMACPTVDLSGKGAQPHDDGTAMAVGPVAGFGGLRVAGANLSGSASAVVVDDLGRGIDDIAAGMTATVRGTLNTSYSAGSASTVTIERELRGPVADNEIDLRNGIIHVLGHTVIVNPATVILDATDNDIGLDVLKGFLDNGYNPALEVHGGVQDNGTVAIRASYIGWMRDDVVDGDDVELRGMVRNIDRLTQTFQIGTQVVNYARLPAGGRANWPPTGLSNGLIADVRGSVYDDAGAQVVRTDRSSSRIAVISADLGKNSNRVTLEGYVLSGFYNSFEMSVPGGTVAVTSGVLPSGDAFDRWKKVRVRGTVSGNDGKRVQASSVFVMKELAVLLEGPPEDLGASEDTIKLLGKTVKTDSYTMFRDPSGGVRDGFGLGSLAPSDIVRVIGWIDGDVTATDGRIMAARLDRIDGTADRIGIQGPVSFFRGDQLSLTILGLTVSTNAVFIDYYDRGGVKLANRNEFYERLVILGVGTIVRVRNALFVPFFSRIDPPLDGSRMELEIVNVNR